ncbi:MAG: glycosyltransferase family 4 protein [Planctomycetes bacterium]|nr:glycosyltransferase family 4 protein [Planctomycetota bacterium]
MRILALTTSYPSMEGEAGGNFIRSLVLALKRRGHEIRVICPGKAGLTGATSLDGVDTRFFRYALSGRGHALTTIEGGIPEAIRRSRLAALHLPSLVACFAASAAASARWADVIWANWLGAGIAGAIGNVFRRRPMVLTLRGDDAYWIHDRRVWRTAGRGVFKRCAAVTAVAGNMADLVRDFMPPSAGEVLVPTFGVDTAIFKPAAREPSQQRPVAGVFVGNVSYAKGVDVLLRALAKTPGDWRFGFVGSGPDLAAMRNLAGELRLGERLTWHGRRPTHQVPHLLGEADFLVLPSLSEGRPNVVLEAMASGLPVIATPVGAVPALIDPPREGLLVPAGNVDALADALTLLVNDANMRADMGRNARARIEREAISWDKTAEEFERIFAAAVAGKRPLPLLP